MDRPIRTDFMDEKNPRDRIAPPTQQDAASSPRPRSNSVHSTSASNAAESGAKSVDTTEKRTTSSPTGSSEKAADASQTHAQQLTESRRQARMVRDAVIP